MPSAALTWIEPGASATLIWHGAAAPQADRGLYVVSGPLLEQPPASPYFLLAAEEAGDFAERLYRGTVGLADLRAFLARCRLARGVLLDGQQYVATDAEVPALEVLDGWRGLEGPPALPYLADISAFMPASSPLYVTAAAHAAARREPEQFTTAWVCEECGEARDAGVFFWTAHRGPRVRVCLLIENDAGVWTCRLHPFEFAKETA
jgi:hypothetical protein